MKKQIFGLALLAFGYSEATISLDKAPVVNQIMEGKHHQIDDAVDVSLAPNSAADIVHIKPSAGYAERWEVWGKKPGVATVTITWDDDNKTSINTYEVVAKPSKKN